MVQFPVPAWIQAYSLSAPPRSFGAPRANGRLHAGCDLYAPIGSEVLAISEGKILRVAPFYWSTWAIEIDHFDLGIVRYGEVAVGPGIAPGIDVAEGMVIASIAQLINPNPAGTNPHPMLHFELYSGKGDGPLTTEEDPYRRRSDLKDPTEFLSRL